MRDKDKPYVKIYGFYRTGTNYFEVLMQRNAHAHVLINQLGHKHSKPVRWARHAACRDNKALALAVRDNKVNVAVVVKDPYGTVWSYLNRLKEMRNKDLFKAGSRRQRNAVREICREINGVYGAWTMLRRPWHARMAVVTYESLLRDRDESLQRVCKRWDIKLADEITDISGVILSGQKCKDTPHDRDFWLRQRYYEELPANIMTTVADTIDWDLFWKLGSYIKR